MTDVFNTVFETSLRVLLVLTPTTGNGDKISETAISRNLDMITALDFATVYSESVGYANKDLHGQNSFGFCEYTARRELIREALKTLVLRGLVDIIKTKDGILYRINKHGYYKVAIELLIDRSAYATEYVNTLGRVLHWTQGKTEQQIIARINEKATQKLGGSNE